MNVFHFTNAQYGLAALRNDRLKVARFSDLNDPFELYAVEMSDRKHRAKFREFKRWASDRFGLLCFCKAWWNPLLWSHYGDRHRGVALQFRVAADDVFAVSYSPKRVLTKMEKRFSHGGFSEDDAVKLATTKFKHWEYENEVRVFVRLSECHSTEGIYFEPFGDRLKPIGIILGPLCALSYSDVRDALPKGRAIRATKSRLAFTSYRVVRQRKSPVTSLRGTGRSIASTGGSRLAAPAPVKRSG